MSTSYEPGAPSSGMIPLAVPELHGNEWAYVKECLDTGWISSVGSFVTRFERDVAAYLGLGSEPGAGPAVAVVNGTAGLHVALLACQVEPEDAVVVPALTFVAPVNAVRYAGAWPIFMDVRPDTWQMDVDKLAEFVADECRSVGGHLVHQATGRRVRALLPVHILGHPVDMDPLLDIARRYDLAVIEDATESLGTRYQGRLAGTLGDVAVLSFNGNKLISTGGGGMIVTADATLAEYARYLTTQAKDDPLEYIHNEIGYNYRLTNVLAAIGVAQLERIDDHIAAKRRIAERYRAGLHDVPGLTLPFEADWAFHTFWLYTVLVHETEFGMDSRALLRALADRGIQSRPLWHPIHTLPPYRDCPAYRVDVADRLYAQALSIPCSVGLSAADQDRVIAAIRDLAQA